MTKVIALTAWLLVGGVAVRAYCTNVKPKVCDEFFASSAVFVGTVTTEKQVLEPGDSIEGWAYQLRVSRLLRGTVGTTVTVHTANDSARRRLTPGHEYLLFASLRDGRLQIGDDCGPLSDPAYAPQAIREIEQLHKATGSVVEGQVADGTSTGGLPGVSVTVSGMGKTYRTKSDTHGVFKIAVPAGRYAVDVDPMIAVPYDLNWVNAKNVSLVQGQCAQLDFIAR